MRFVGLHAQVFEALARVTPSVHEVGAQGAISASASGSGSGSGSEAVSSGDSATDVSSQSAGVSALSSLAIPTALAGLLNSLCDDLASRISPRSSHSALSKGAAADGEREKAQQGKGKGKGKGEKEQIASESFAVDTSVSERLYEEAAAISQVRFRLWFDFGFALVRDLSCFGLTTCLCLLLNVFLVPPVVPSGYRACLFTGAVWQRAGLSVHNVGSRPCTAR